MSPPSTGMAGARSHTTPSSRGTPSAERFLLVSRNETSTPWRSPSARSRSRVATPAGAAPRPSSSRTLSLSQMKHSPPRAARCRRDASAAPPPGSETRTLMTRSRSCCKPRVICAPLASLPSPMCHLLRPRQPTPARRFERGCDAPSSTLRGRSCLQINPRSMWRSSRPLAPPPRRSARPCLR